MTQVRVVQIGGGAREGILRLRTGISFFFFLMGQHSALLPTVSVTYAPNYFTFLRAVHGTHRRISGRRGNLEWVR